jgi:hypothetical protein
MDIAAKLLDALGPQLIVNVTYSDGFYTAVCDDLHLVAEAETLEELQNQVWELAPELIELNSLPIKVETWRKSCSF